MLRDVDNFCHILKNSLLKPYAKFDRDISNFHSYSEKEQLVHFFPDTE